MNTKVSNPVKRVTWPDVLGATRTEQTRLAVTIRFREAGFTADQFAHSAAARRAACDALTYAEDALELQSRGRMTEERVAMRTVRRRLECE